MAGSMRLQGFLGHTLGAGAEVFQCSACYTARYFNAIPNQCSAFLLRFINMFSCSDTVLTVLSLF